MLSMEQITKREWHINENGQKPNCDSFRNRNRRGCERTYRGHPKSRARAFNHFVCRNGDCSGLSGVTTGSAD